MNIPLIIFLWSSVFLGHATVAIRDDQLDRRTVDLDQAFLEEPPDLEQDKTKRQFRKNPRNEAFSESFGGVGSRQEQVEALEVQKKEERKKTKAEGADYKNKKIWR